MDQRKIRVKCNFLLFKSVMYLNHIEITSKLSKQKNLLEYYKQDKEYSCIQQHY